VISEAQAPDYEQENIAEDQKHFWRERILCDFGGKLEICFERSAQEQIVWLSD